LANAQKKPIKYIDVLWLDSDNHIEAAFEIEYTTPIYSGLLRMLDLVTLRPNITIPLYIVVPKARVEQVKAELSRPAFNNKSLKLHHKVQVDCY
jgi:type II restriction enzyme